MEAGMLSELHIENIAIIEKASINFNRGLNVLTGETGAGKSIIIDSINAILGSRVNRDIIRNGEERSTVTAVFKDVALESWLEDNEIDLADELILARRISSDGKNSCRINGVPVTLSQLRDIGNYLIDVYGQNDGRQLLDESRQRIYLDNFGKLNDDLLQYQEEYNKFSLLKKELNKLNINKEEKERQLDTLRFIIGELEEAALVPGEEAELVARRDLLHNSEKLSEGIHIAKGLLDTDEYNAQALMEQACSALRRVSEFSNEVSSALVILENISSNVTDAVERLNDVLDTMNVKPGEYNSLESRLSELHRLERKYHTDEDGLINKLEDSKLKLSLLENSDYQIEKLSKEAKEQYKKCCELAKKLSQKRRAAGEQLEKGIEQELSDLSMPNAVFKVSIESKNDIDAFGIDKVQFLMSANLGEQVNRISRIASGGELSRIMLAMKNVFSSTDPVSTMIFDEIDSGVSGVAAQRIGEKLATLSRTKQVICVTHLPQIASIADTHYKISKQVKNGRTITMVHNLDFNDRTKEIARLFGGENITPLTLASAKEQLYNANLYKKGIS
jgi:DNA repair protein RecN (Recombination protein N)